MTLHYVTSGESHGEYLTAILQGLPSGISVDAKFIQNELKRRQEGFGRGGRQQIESDEVKITGGVYKGKTTGAPIGFLLHNQDVTIDRLPQLFRPRPGHADLAGSLKYNEGIREILERASARETVMRVAVGALTKLLLSEGGICVASHVVRIGSVSLPEGAVTFDDIAEQANRSPVRCICKKTERKMISEIEDAMKRRDTVGGVFEVRVKGVPLGLGSHAHYARKLDARLALAIMSIQSVKAVEFGGGFRLAEVGGHEAHDEIFYKERKGYFHETNRAGGIEGGMSNGEEIIVRAAMKPIATLRQPLRSVNMKTKKAELADFERADVCAVPAGSVIGEAVVAYEIADAFLEKFGGDSLEETLRNCKGYLNQLKKAS